MKKFILILLAMIIMFFVYSNNKVDAEVIIPDGAIRVRVIANSNSLYDQSIKMKVKDYIEKKSPKKMKTSSVFQDLSLV